MKTTRIITSARQFIDIDAFACIFAYQELLKLKNQDVLSVVTAVINASVTSKYRDLEFFEKDVDVLVPIENKEFIIVDTSNPEVFERFVEIDAVSHIFDHHTGFEMFWKEKVGDCSIIEPIGAAATLIFREYKKHNLLDKITPTSAELLAVAILSNTIFFQAKISKDEDRSAYEELKQYFPYTETFERDYFSEVQSTIEGDITASLRDDSKSDMDMLIAQLEVWDAKHIINNFFTDIRVFITDAAAEISFLNLIEIGKKRNMIIFKNNRSLEYMRQYFPEFDYDDTAKIAITPHVVLRKEMLAKMHAPV